MYHLDNPFLATLLNISAEGVVIQDVDGRIVFTNHAANHMLDLDPQTIVGGTTSDLAQRIVREDGSPLPDHDHPGIKAVRTGEASVGVIMGAQHGDGRPTTWFSVNSAKVVDPASGVPLVFTLFADITEPIETAHRLRDVTERLQQSNAALRETESRLQTIVQTIPDLVWTKDVDGVYLDCNPEFERFFGATRAEIIGKTDYDFVDAPQADFFRHNDRLALASETSTTNEEFITYASDGREVLLETVKTPMRDAEGRVTGVLGISRNITAHRDAEDRLRAAVTNLEALTSEFHELSQTDPLTRLPNRRALDDALENERRRQRRSKETAALMMIDIDRFKQVNDAYGHDVGDHVLVELARVLRMTVRTTDLPTRFGGEEFVVLLTATQPRGAVEMAERIRTAVESLRIAHPDGNFGITVSIGVASILPDDRDWANAITRADHAMYRAKEQGRNRVESADTLATSG